MTKKAVISLSVAAIAAVPVLGLAVPAGASPAVASASHDTVAYNWWKGDHLQGHYYGSVRPSVWGGYFGEPITSIHWVYWHQGAAEAKGLYVFMSCQPCHETVYLHDVKTSHGTRYFEEARETGAWSENLHWTGRDWLG